MQSSLYFLDFELVTFSTVLTTVKCAFRYNPDNLTTLEKYVEIQSRENAYDLEANLAVLKLYQLNPHRFNMDIACQILLKALTNLPHTDFVLCKCLLSEKLVTLIVTYKISFFFMKVYLQAVLLISRCQKVPLVKSCTWEISWKGAISSIFGTGCCPCQNFVKGL